MATTLKAYVSGAFTAKPVKVWNGSAWVAKPLKRWDGSAWVGGGAIVAPAFRNFAFKNYGAGFTESTVDKPAGTADGDILIATLFTGKNAAHAYQPAPAGFTLIGQTSVSEGVSFYGKLQTWWKRAASEAVNYTFFHDDTYSTELTMIAYSGCTPSGSPIDAFTTNSGTSLTSKALSLTTTQANDKLVLTNHNWDASGGLSPPTGMAEIFDHLVYLSDQTIAAAGPTGDRDQTLASSNPWGAILLALKGT
jgi:hypothetical protein